jgi:predicted nuclease of predicted toxin-antitoxin system
VKLLLDQNLPAWLLDLLGVDFPGCAHIKALRLERETDRAIWEYARLEGYPIMTKDADFNELSILFGIRQKLYGSLAETYPT